MKKYILSLLLIAWSFGCLLSQDQSQTLLEKANGFSFFDSPSYKLDLKFIDPAKGYFGIDYKINLEKKIASLGKKDSFKSIKFNLKSNGFITVYGEGNQLNSIISTAEFQGFPIFYKKPKSTTQVIGSWEDEVEEEELIDQSRQLAQQVASPLWIFGGVNIKHETTQDFKEYDFALGANIAITTSFLNAILDFPFGLIRTSANNNPRQLDLSFGYDYVIGLENTALSELRGDENNANRLNFKAEWETGILTKADRILLYIDSYYELNAPKLIEDNDKDFNYFFVAQIDHILSVSKKNGTRTIVSLKYTNGALPPNFEQGYVIGGGFSFLL